MNELEQFARSGLKAVGQQLAAQGIGHNWHYRLAGWRDGPRAVSLYLDVKPVHLAKVVAILTGLTNKTTMRTAVRQTGRLSNDIQVRMADGPQGTVAIEIGKPEHLWIYPTVDWPGLEGDRFDVAVGLINDGRVARLDFNDPNTPAALVAGLPGSGKTNAVCNLVRAVCLQNTPDEAAFLFIDASSKAGVDFEPLDGLAHRLADPITDPDLALAGLRWSAARLDGSDNRHLFIVVEEATDLVNLRPEAAELLSTLGRGGRAAGIHLIEVFHNPIVDNVGQRDVAAMIPARLVGRVADAMAAKVATNQTGTGAERLSGKGDMLFVSPSQNLVRVIVPLVTPTHLEKLPRAGVQPIDLSDFADPVNLPAIGGRQPDPPDFKLIGRLLQHLVRRQQQGTGPLSGSTLGKKLEPMARAEKVDRHLQWARDVLDGIVYETKYKELG